ncbi:ACP S-malonyltransferase [Xanthomonas sacchari]|uniref:ACP S-malonyltransferase n=1 Tax=Xanthomonas sacchari TaxID=56458 RepID=UPI0022516124|nr:ACP S-malonyltransferase [Xanthomonas sacchari]MCW0447193.1 Polyketide biosynthesis malonyl CoA-acyl carrier protein transacylase PksC [Xanthomonas sacchari]
MLAMIFPGQGSQKPGMGGDLFDLDDYLAVESQVDALLGYSLRGVCLRDGDKLADTRYTQPCLYIVNALHGIRSARDGAMPGCFAGHSLGEYNALQAAGVFDLMTGLRLVHKRASLMAQVHGGAMVAVLGLEAKRIIEIMLANRLDTVDVANYNAPLQTVISGSADQVDRAAQLCESAGATACVRLAVSGAFHSRSMERAARAFAGFISEFVFERPRVPVVSNVTGVFYPADASSAVIASLLVRQIARPVLWVKCVESMLRAGATSFAEAGPGNVLSRLVAQIRAASPSPIH